MLTLAVIHNIIGFMIYTTLLVKNKFIPTNFYWTTIEHSIPVSANDCP